MCSGSGPLIRRMLIVHNARHTAVEEALTKVQQDCPAVSVQHHPVNLGLAASWNAFILADPEVSGVLVPMDVGMAVGYMYPGVRP